MKWIVYTLIIMFKKLSNLLTSVEDKIGHVYVTTTFYLNSIMLRER